MTLQLGRPQNKSLIGALVVAVVVLIGSQTSAVIGYALALLALIMIVVAEFTKSIWPTKGGKENAFVFSLFWGLILGGIVPFIITTFLEGGVSAVFKIFS
ncbi:MAG: hypothetical protein RLY69_1031 [Verrucomicrobiota bacterium]